MQAEKKNLKKGLVKAEMDSPPHHLTEGHVK